MLTVTAGNTSVALTPTDENDLVIVRPAANSTGYAEVSYNAGATWTIWRAGWVTTEAQQKAGQTLPQYRGVCVTGSITFGITTKELSDSQDTIEEHIAAHAAIGLVAASPAPTYSATGKLLTATINGRALINTYDANDNLQTSNDAGVIHTYTWTLGVDGNYHIASII